MYLYRDQNSNYGVDITIRREEKFDNNFSLETLQKETGLSKNVRTLFQFYQNYPFQQKRFLTKPSLHLSSRVFPLQLQVFHWTQAEVNIILVRTILSSSANDQDITRVTPQTPGETLTTAGPPLEAPMALEERLDQSERAKMKNQRGIFLLKFFFYQK